MSTPRRRPTREETRRRLFEAAAEVFSTKGIAAASIEDICTAAGFSRGAFYSNFKAKDDLVLELLDQDLTENMAEVEQLFEQSNDPASFIESMESDKRRRATPIGGDSILYMELILYVLRNPENRPRLVERQRRTHELNRAVVEQVIDAVGKPYPVPIDDAVTFIIAFDQGMQLLRLIEPDAYRPTQFSETLLAIHQMWADGS